MRIGLIKRIASYLLDIVPIISVIIILHTLFIGTLLQKAVSPDYNQIYEDYLVVEQARQDTLANYNEQLDNGEITDDEYLEMRETLTDEYYEENQELITPVTMYFGYSMFYFLIAINLVYLIYVVGMKGQTLGRKILKIQLVGNVKWHTLIMREFFWKNLLYSFGIIIGIGVNPILGLMLITLFIGLDVALIQFTKKKSTLRDMFSNTYLTPEGVNYPF